MYFFFQHFDIREDINTIKRVSNVLNEVASPMIATFKIDYAEGSVVYIFTLPDKSLSVIKVNHGELIRKFSCTSEEDQGKIHIFVKENGIRSSLAVDRSAPRFRQASCDDLGPRLAGEAFGDCFQRNWNNFCCDFIGCVAQISNPQIVAASIVLICVC